MNIKKLELFLAIANSGSFSKGAELLCITQSTASQHIASMEESCGLILFDRTGRGVKPTEAGKILIKHAEKVTSSLREAEQAILRFSKADGVKLSVGGSSIPGTYILPKAIAKLIKIEPKILVDVNSGDTQDIITKLMSEQIEVGVIGQNTDEASLSSEPLDEDLILLVAEKHHRWCGQQNIELIELLKEPLIWRESGSGTNAVVLLALKKFGIQKNDLKICSTFSSSEAVKQATLAGCGVAFISEIAVRGELEKGELVSIPLLKEPITRSFYLTYRKGRALSPAANVFCNIMRKYFNTKY